MVADTVAAFSLWALIPVVAIGIAAIEIWWFGREERKSDERKEVPPDRR